MTAAVGGARAGVVAETVGVAAKGSLGEAVATAAAAAATATAAAAAAAEMAVAARDWAAVVPGNSTAVAEAEMDSAEVAALEAESAAEQQR